MDDPESLPPDPKAARRLGLALLAALVLGAAAYALLRPSRGPSSGAIANDPLLAAGQAIYNERCIGCHGPAGRGDGAIARTLGGTPPGDLADGHWKYGDRPEDVVRVIRDGVPGTTMTAWKAVFDEPQARALAVYVDHLAGDPVPAALRGP